MTTEVNARVESQAGGQVPVRTRMMMTVVP